MKTTCVQFVSPVTKFSWECVCLKIIVKTINVSTALPQVFVPSVGVGFYLLSNGYCSNLYLIFGIFIPFAASIFIIYLVVIATIAACLYEIQEKSTAITYEEVITRRS